MSKNTTLFKHKAASSLKGKGMVTIPVPNTVLQQSIREMYPTVIVQNEKLTEIDDSDAMDAAVNQHFDEEGFITPKRGKYTFKPTSPTTNITDNSAPPSKRYVLDSSSLLKQNKFNYLSDHSYSHDPNAIEMDSDESSSPAKTEFLQYFCLKQTTTKK